MSDFFFIESVRQRTTPFTYVLLALNLAVFLLMELAGGTRNEATLLAFGVKSNAAIDAGEIWRFITPVFIHIGFLHLILNSYALWIVGQQVERFYGSARFVTLYLLMGMAGVAGSYLYHPEAISAGASGAIFGLFGVLLIFGIRNRRKVPVFLSRAIMTGILPVIAINLGIGLIIPAIDNAAHVGGLLAGMALAAVVNFKVPGSQTPPLFRIAQVAALFALLLSFVQVAAHYDGPRPSLSNLSPSLRGTSASQDFIDAINTAQRSFGRSQRAIEAQEFSSETLEDTSERLSRSISLLGDVPSLSREADQLVAELQRVMERRYSLIQDMIGTSQLEPDRKRSFDDNTSEYREVMASLVRWVETEGGSHGLQIRSSPERQ